MKLEALIIGLEPIQIIGPPNLDIKSLEFDSRKVSESACFVAINGLTVDGHNYIENAIQKGAVSIVLEKMPADLHPEVTYVQVTDSADALGRMASRFFDQPSRKIKLIGVTGTNGKTTTVTLLHDLFTRLGYKTGLLSTVENRIGSKVISASYTTPDAISLNSLLADMVEAGCDFAFMEVSSHAVAQRRVAGVFFCGGVFTNISHDHLDFHKTFKAYIEAKKSFFDQLSPNAFALINIDDRRGEVMVQNTAARVYRYSLRRMADYRARIMDNSLLGLHLLIDNKEFFGRLIGSFNAYNLLSVYATALLLGQDMEEVLTVLSQLKSAEGRFDYLLSPNRDITGIVDYAHTPDALEKVLTTIGSLKGGDSKVVTVVGCGGDRDKAKRPRMAQIACTYSEQVILTSDNPRSEDPDRIIKDMEAGVPLTDRRKVLSLVNRREAIRTACRLAKKGDIILVAGKGHEKYQEIKGVKYPFDDKEILKAEFESI